MLTLLHRVYAAALVLFACVSAASAAAPYPSLRVSIVKPAAPPPAQAQAQQTGTTPTLKTSVASDASDKASLAEEESSSQPALALIAPTNDQITASAEPAPISPPAPVAKTWSVSLSDGNVRQALARWALDAGWTVAWEVPVDIPLTANADLATTTDFHEAVAVLADAVAMGETPIRPCFYANQVVRLLPYNAVCDRTGTRPPSPNP